MVRFAAQTILLMAFVLFAVIAPAAAQPWPARTVTIVVPFPAGGSTDIVARLMAEEMRAQFNGAFVIENKPGATGNLGVVQVAKSPPDGYTLLFSTSAPVATNVLIFKHPPLDPRKELTPIALVADVPLLVAVNPKLPIHNVAELLAYDKANPGKLNFGHAGIGGMGHMASELLASMEGRTFNSIPYQGSAPVTKDLMAGMVDVAFDFAPSYIPQVQAGTIRAIAVTTAQRLPDLPDVPTIAEQGIANYEASSFVALLGPAGLPADLVTKLNMAVNDWLNTDAAKQALAQQTMRPLGGTPEMLRNRIQSEIEKWGPVVKRTGIALGN
ncbi:MAG: tripartite tricarboxylate transporter substrate binding protein [Xanthobacteraceae bacterium]|nr:tripartite tricarboxylate transporter substrate binding protein [Xanthobacteraceae bacterium]MBV9632301.1 tripartite tricarboxylate transporter substrate binding protein [Xanthobacteraceae bacterium]